MFAAAAPGLEPIVARELEPLGAKGVSIVEGGVNFRGDLTTLYEANLSLRVASRVVVRIAEFHADSFHELERRVRRIRWSEYLKEDSAVRFRVTARKSRLYHSDAVAQRFAEGIAREFPNVRFSVSSDEEDHAKDGQLFIVRLFRDRCVVSVDSSGELLHRRGYRLATGKAPLRETLAAAMVLASGWDCRSPLIDPMCGSGTVAIEAALLARGMKPGRLRRFAFQGWPSYHPDVVTDLNPKKQKNAFNGAILASDRDDGAVKAALANAERAGVADDIQFETKSLSAMWTPQERGIILTNPPYGTRVGNPKTLRNLYAQLGNVLREKARGYTAALLSADKALERQLRLPLQELFRTTNGGIPVRLVRGDIR
jgi:putative N6-adenine-specific DNA methylase